MVTPQDTNYYLNKQEELANKPKAEYLKVPYIGSFNEGDEPYDITDFPTVRNRINTNVQKAIETRFPLESNKYILTVENLKYQGDGKVSLADERDALWNNKTVALRLKGDWVLYDKETGTELQRKNTTMLNVPYMTDRGSFIRKGSEYGLKNMFRLKSGAYTRIKNDGVISTHINPEQGTGRQAQINMDPATGVFTYKMGTRNYGLLPLLKSMGYPEDLVKETWGEELYNANAIKYKGILSGKDVKGKEEYDKLWSENLINIKMDPDTTEQTLGIRYKALEPHLVVQATQKMLKLATTMDSSQGDSRDSMQFQKIMGPADYLAERIVKDGGGIFRNILNSIDRTGNLDVVPTGAFQSQVDSVFLEDKHAGYIDGSSPLEALDYATGVSRLGEGGIGDTRAAPNESRGVQNSYLGFVDPVRSVECYSEDTEIMTKYGWISVKDVTLRTSLACLIDDNLHYKQPSQVNVYDYKGTMLGVKSDELEYLVTPDHRMYLSQPEGLREILQADEVQGKLIFLYSLPQTENEKKQGWGHTTIVTPEHHYTEEYEGKVYCPTVPGGIVYVRRNNKRGFWCGNSMKVGLENYLTHGVRKDSKGNLYAKFIAKGDAAPSYVDMVTTSRSIVATPEYFNPKGDPNEYIPAFVKGKDIEYVPRKEVDFFLYSADNMMSKGAATIPGIGGIRSNRTLMGCLHPDTMVTVYVNGMKNNMRASWILANFAQYDLDLVVGIDARGNDIKEPLRGVHRLTGYKTLYKVTFSSGIEEVVTHDHKWGTNKGLLKTSDPTFLRSFVPSLKGEVLVTMVEEICANTPYVVDLDVNDNLYLLSSGVFTHNSKYGNQALSLVNREAPLIQSELRGDDDNVTTMERLLGAQLGAKFSPIKGEVVGVSDDSITVKGADGKKQEIELYNNFPANQKGFIHNTAKVEVGDKVEQGQLLAKSNYTDDEGVGALGVNVKMAFLNAPDAGTFEDAATVSETAAKTKFASEQLYKVKSPVNSEMEYNKNKYVSLFKTSEFTHEQLDKLDENGVAKEGTILEYGDPVMLAVQHKDPSIRGIAKHAVAPYIQTWDHHYPGTVTHVSSHSKENVVYTKSFTPLQVGDKGCYDDKTEVLTNAGWKLFKDVADNDKVLTLDLASGNSYFTDYRAKMAYTHEGALYYYESKDVSLRLTREHQHLSAPTPSLSYAKLEQVSTLWTKKHRYHIVGVEPNNTNAFSCFQQEGAKMGKVKYNGIVYCLEIPETHIMYVKRNGKTVWSGNSNRYGAKFTVGAILPDDQMPIDESDGQPFDILQSPLGVVTRCNPKQLAESQLSKVAKKLGKSLALPKFSSTDVSTDVANLLKEHGLSETATVYDPVTGKRIPDVTTGYMFMYKLKHMADYKQGARGTGDYTSEDVPSKGGQTSCFVADQKIRTLGGYKDIGTIVKNKSREFVWSLNKSTGEWGYHPVVNWFKYTSPADAVLSIHVEGVPGIADTRHYKWDTALYPTPNHRMYLYDGTEITAGELKVGDMLSSFGPCLTQVQKEVALGTLVGDGYWGENSLVMCHSIQQDKYVQFKRDLFSGLYSHKERYEREHSESSVVAKLAREKGREIPIIQSSVLSVYSYELLYYLRELNCFQDNPESSKYLELNDAILDKMGIWSLIMWYLDDGTTYTDKHGRPKTKFCTQGHSENNLHYLTKLLYKVLGEDIKVAKRLDRKSDAGVEQYTLCLGKKDSIKLMTLVAQYVPAPIVPLSKRTLVKFLTEYQQEHGTPTVPMGSPLGKVPCRIKRIENYLDTHKVKNQEQLNVYDIEVETAHNYMAGDVLVSNSRRLGSLEVGALVGHAGPNSEIIKDAKLVRGQRNDEFWRDVRNGYIPDKPGTPLVHKKFLSHLQAAGINLKDQGDRISMFSATDKDIRNLTQNRQVSKAATFANADLQPVTGGLFDPNIFGSDGDQWGYYELPEPILNPLMFKSVSAILGWKDGDLRGVLEGSKEVDGMIGSEAVMQALDKINLEDELKKTKHSLKEEKLSSINKDKARKKYRALYAIKEQGAEADDYFLTRVPILPPKFRAVSSLDDNQVNIVADANFLYKRLMDNSEDFKEAQKVLPPEEQLDARKSLYNSLEAVIGLKDPTDAKLQDKQVGGLLKWAFGKSSPKLSSLHRKVLGATVDIGARGVIVPSNKLSIDQVGLPENSAWDIYEPFITRKLKQRGHSLTSAADLVLNKDDEAKQCLLEAMKERPVIINRSPTLHKYGIMAAEPVLVKGDTLKIPPAICKVFNADFDGNCLDYNSEIFLKSAPDNEFSRAILTLDKTRTLNIERLKSMSNVKNMLVTVCEEGFVSYVGPIGALPRLGEPMKDSNGADVYTLPEGVKVLSYDYKNNTSSWEDVSYYTVEQNCDVVEVRAGTHELIVSDNESLAIFDHANGGLKKEAPKNSKGKLIPTLRQMPVSFGNYGNAHLGWVHGMFISDGWISGRVVGIAKLEDVKRDYFVEGCLKISSDITVREYASSAQEKGKLGNSMKTHLVGNELYAHFYDLDVYDYSLDLESKGVEKSARRKTINYKMIMEGSEDYLWGLLSGLLDGDGSITCNTSTGKNRFGAHLSTSSPFLRDSFKLLCYRLGLRVSVTTTPPRGHSNEAYALSISSVDLQKNLSKLCCKGAKETEVLVKWAIAPLSLDRNDFVPLTKDEVKYLRPLLLAIGDSATYGGIAKGYACRETFKRAIEALDDSYKTSETYQTITARVYDTETLWVQVKSIKALDKREVFDLAVETTKVFVANSGLVVWDTMNYHVPVTNKAVKEAREKLLPSKNILSPNNLKAHITPVGEFAQGLWLASRKDSNVPVKFKSKEEAMQALHRGDITYSTQIEIG